MKPTDLLRALTVVVAWGLNFVVIKLGLAALFGSSVLTRPLQRRAQAKG